MNYKIEKIKDNKFTIDLSECNFDHNILFTQPYNGEKYNWTVIDEEGNNIGEYQDDKFIELKGGIKYSLITNDKIDPEKEKIENKNNSKSTPGFIFIILLSVIACFIIFKKIRKTN